MRLDVPAAPSAGFLVKVPPPWDFRELVVIRTSNRIGRA